MGREVKTPKSPSLSQDQDCIISRRDMIKSFEIRRLGCEQNSVGAGEIDFLSRFFQTAT